MKCPICDFEYDKEEWLGSCPVCFGVD